MTDQFKKDVRSMAQVIFRNTTDMDALHEIASRAVEYVDAHDTTHRQETTMSKPATKPMSILEQLRKASDDPSNWDVVGIMNDAHDEIARLRNEVQIFELANVHQFEDENGKTWFSARGISRQTEGVRYRSMWEAVAAVRRLHCLPVEATE